MKLEDLDFHYPENLVATERRPESRVLSVAGGIARELKGLDELLAEFRAGDCLVINDSRVLKRRVFALESGLEILFLAPTDPERVRWRVLCPSSRWKNATRERLPEGIELDLVERGRTQIVQASRPLDEAFFETHGEMPLPPYIQKARGERHNRQDDRARYQTAWARSDGSLAAPTASLHFSNTDLERLAARGVRVETLTLHVGLGTFMPISAATLEEHVMHAELVAIPRNTWASVQRARSEGGRVWALGTTVARALESAALGRLEGSDETGFAGETDLFIRPGEHSWRAVDVLMTNFHQPRSTLLALVASFAGLETVHRAYAWAVEREFRLFSYGDLSVWSR